MLNLTKRAGFGNHGGPFLDKPFRAEYLGACPTERSEPEVRILAVEDEPEYLEMIQEVLGSLGHTIALAGNGTEALGLLDQQQIDVIISDVKMPVMDGVDFHARVRAIPRYRNTPFIFLTGVSDLSRVKEACSTDTDLLLQKPFPVDSLLRLFAGKLP